MSAAASQALTATGQSGTTPKNTRSFPLGRILLYTALTVAALAWVLPIWWTVINATKSSHDFFFHSFYALPREFDLFSNISAAWSGAGSVSYTHLDVYKRQLENRSNSLGRA